MKLIVTGSIAFDYLMSFPGKFTEHILPEHLQRVSLSFLVDSMDKRRGGCAPNIAYTLALLGEEMERAPYTGVIHCFTASDDFAKAALDLGLFISISGIVTFKNARDLQETAARLPIERLLIETDAPFLAPVPHRGKTNQPGFVLHVAEEISRLRGISIDAVCTATTNNFGRLFKCLH